jgi:hypothetical protein
MVQVRRKLTTPEAQRMGVQAAREWESERQLEQAAFDKQQAKERRKEDFVRPLLEAGISTRAAEDAYRQHVLENAKERGEHARTVTWRSRMRSV